MPGETPLLKPRTLIEILDSAFRLYRENFLTFLAMLAIIYVPVSLVVMGITAWLYSDVMIPNFEDPNILNQDAYWKFMMVSIAVFFINAVLYAITIPFATGALTQGVGRIYLNQKISLGESYAAVGRIFLKYLGTVLLKGLVTALGIMCCLVPGILFLIWFVFAPEICILEGSAGTQAMGRSKELVKGHEGNVFVMGLLLLLLQIVMTVAIHLFGGFVAPLLTEGFVLQNVYSQGFAQILTLLAQPFMIISWILLYYDIRIRKEAFDLEVLARSLSARPASPSAP